MSERSLLNHGFAGSTWGNLGLWTDAAQSYPAACEELAIRLAERADFKRGSSVLDVGFGYGDQLLVWKQRFGVGRITGIEIDATGVDAALGKLVGHADVSLYLDHDFPKISENKNDFVVALDCAYHFRPRSAFFAQAFRALNPGGAIALTDVIVDDSFDSERYARLARFFRIPPKNLLTQRAYAQSLESLGFCNIRFETLDEEVFVGFSKFAFRLLRQRGIAALSAAGLKILLTAVVARWLGRNKRIHYMLVVANRPEI